MLHIHNKALVLRILDENSIQIDGPCWPFSNLWMCYQYTLDWPEQALKILLSDPRHTGGGEKMNFPDIKKKKKTQGKRRKLGLLKNPIRPWW